jgi:hypothetical protein
MQNFRHTSSARGAPSIKNEPTVPSKHTVTSGFPPLNKWKAIVFVGNMTPREVVRANKGWNWKST